MVQTVHGWWLMYDAHTAEVVDTAEDAADALACATATGS
jgi:hypothetical protein